MKRNIIITAAMALVVVFGGCLSLGRKPSDDTNAPQSLTYQMCDYRAVNENIDGFSLGGVYDNLSDFKGYTYTGEDYEYFYMAVDSGVEMSVLIVPSGKNCDMAFTISDAHQVSLNGLSVNYSINRRSYEDFYKFTTAAIVSGGGDVAYVRYVYSSRQTECDLIDMLSVMFISGGEEL